MDTWTWASAPELLLPLMRLKSISWFDSLLGYPPIKALLPIPILLALAPAVYWFFKDTWRELDREAAAARAARADSGELDLRPAACLTIVAVVLTLQEYYGGRQFYDTTLRPWLVELDRGGATWLKLDRYDELYGYSWWAFSRALGYVLVPLPLWKLMFPKDSLLDMGFRFKGLLSHLWIYGLCLAVVVPAMLIVASQPDFGGYYPFYKNSSRSWFDLISWEVVYFIQFLTLEMFFRGWMVGALRKSLGSGAIFAMAVPYCMIHYGKPYLEAHGAIVAGVVLGSLAMRTRSIYSGFLVHITVALLMDLLALWKRDALPTTFWAAS
ncbi:MAG: CPBP family intramembrane metalloprotease [Polyangiaceae bacterium]|nr:CPBP family intramembrane metalloprotease [Polyangiaceae bacterium]